MAEAKLHTDLLEARAELQRLRDSMSVGAPTIHKDMSLVTLIPKWTGSDSAVTLEEFLASVESAARIGRWVDSDMREIATLKLAGSAKVFYQGCNELHENDATWETFKSAFRRRYEDVHTDQFHFTRLQTARQAKGESPQEFADRCRGLAQKVMARTNDPQAQRVHRENADRMLLASFVSGLTGTPGRQVRYANPQTLEQALKIALSVQEAEKQERFNESFYTKFDESVRLSSRSPSPAHAGSRHQRHSADGREVNHTRSQQSRIQGSIAKSENRGTRNARTKDESRCFECNGWGHFARECPTRYKREGKPIGSPGKRGPRERPKRPRSPGSKPPHANEREARKEATSSGNASRV